MLKKVGITGGIGSGKTTVCKIFETLGVPIYYADLEAKKIISINPAVKRQIKELLGAESYYKNGKPNKAFIASKIFSDKSLLESMNKIVHPALQTDVERWYENIKSKLPDDNYLKTKLQFNNNTEGEEGLKSIIINGGASLSVDESNRITEAFENLYRLAPQIAKDLVTFSIFQSGVINSPVTIYHVIPDHILKEVALPNKQSINLFQDLLNNAQTYSKEDVIKKLVLSVDTKLGERKSKYKNKMLTLLAEKNIKVC